MGCDDPGGWDKSDETPTKHVDSGLFVNQYYCRAHGHYFEHTCQYCDQDDRALADSAAAALASNPAAQPDTPPPTPYPRFVNLGGYAVVEVVSREQLYGAIVEYQRGWDIVTTIMVGGVITMLMRPKT